MDVTPVGNDSITICHWTEGAGRWEAITINQNALNGHANHSLDVWPEVDDVTDGMNWPEGETLYLSGCVFATSPSPSPSPSPSESSTGTATATPAPTDILPPTGPVETSGMLLVALGCLLPVCG